MDHSWMPPPGRRSIAIGSSLSRALKARALKGDAPAPKSLHARDFYSFRYNFKPPSIDPSERGKITVKKGKDTTSVTVERPSTQSSEAHVFVGGEILAKEWDCVLIYDDVQDTYTLEKLDSYMTLKYDRKVAAPERITPPVAPGTKRDLKLSRELDEALGDDNQSEAAIPQSLSRREEEEEEPEEGEMRPIPQQPQPQPQPEQKPQRRPKARTTAPPPPETKPTPAPPPAKAKLKQAAPAKAQPAMAPTPLPAASALSSLPQAPAPPRGKKHKREPDPEPEAVSYADEEDLEFGKPAKPAKRARVPPPRAAPVPTPLPPPPLPPPKPSEGLALPGVSTPVVRPPPVVVHPPSSAAAAAAAADAQSESEDEWYEVAAVGQKAEVETEDDFDIFGEAAGAPVLPPSSTTNAAGAGEDMDDLERQINLQMSEESEEDEDDFLADVVEEVPASKAGEGPISLNAFAGGQAAGDYGSDDDYSSSDSDED